MDNHATTRTDPRVVEEMLPYFTEKYGNAASRNHEFGWVAEQAVEQARERIAKADWRDGQGNHLYIRRHESDNLAIKGVAEMYKEKGNHIITQAIEHKAVARHLQAPGEVWIPRYLSAGAEGRTH